MTRVALVGAGRMGTPVLRRLLAAGHDVRVLGRTPGSRDRLAGLGATPGGTVEEVAAGAEVVVVCVFTDDQVREVCLGTGLLDRLRPGATLVVHTTGGPGTAASLADAAAPRGADVVDAPFSGGPHDIEAGRITVYAGGSDAAVARVRPLLRAYADPVLHVGPVGTGQAVKLVNNALFAAHLGLLREAVDLGHRLDVPEAALLAALGHGSGASRALGVVAARGSVAAFLGTAREFVGKDVDVVRRVAAEAGGGLGALEPALAALTAPTAPTAPTAHTGPDALADRS